MPNELSAILNMFNVQVSGDVQQSGSGLISSGQSGYLVITPFKLAGRE